jgi:hypothetical protein
MSHQGAFRPSTNQSNVTTIPVPIGGVNAYQHGQTWHAIAAGWLRGSQVFVNDIITAINYAEPEAITSHSSQKFYIGMPGGFPMSLNCEQLIVRLDLRNPYNPDYGDIGLWDASLWDDTSPPSNGIWAGEWDAWTVISDRVRGIQLRRGRTSSWNDIQSGQVVCSVDNKDGYFSAFGFNGDPRFRLNTGFYVGALWRGVEYPLFKGRIKEFSEDDLPGESGATFTAFDVSADLVSEVAAEYNAGSPYDLAGVRINKILDLAGITETRAIAAGESTLTNYKTQRNFLDEIRVSALSDGGLFFVDNDGTVMYMDRERLNGRIRDGIIPFFSDACTHDKLSYAAIEMAWNDHEFGNIVTISNVSLGQEASTVAIASDVDSINKYGEVSWTTVQLTIANVEHLPGLAEWELSRRKEAYYRVNRFEVYPAHDDRIWLAMLSMRLGDSMFVERTPPGNPFSIIAEFLCDGYQIEGTPELWKFIVYCSPAIDILGRKYGEELYGEGSYGYPTT